MSVIVIKVSIKEGANPEDAKRQAAELAKKTGVCVDFIVGDTFYIAYPNGRVFIRGEEDTGNFTVYDNEYNRPIQSR